MAQTNDAGVRHPSTRGVAAAAQLSVAVLLCSCQDPAVAPLPLTVTSAPAATTSGAIITLTSEQFSGLTLVPSPDTLRPSRWTNFAVIVGSDTAESWRVAPTQIAFRIPPVFTGNYEALIDAEGYNQVRIPFFAVGMAHPVYARLDQFTNVSTGTPFNSRGVLIGEGFYALLDVQAQRLQTFPELPTTTTNRPKMYTPGPSYLPNHFVFDLSPAGVVAPTVWRADPWTSVKTIPCGDRAFYTAAELSSTTCLALVLGGQIVRNGVDTLLPPQSGLFDSQFRLSPGGKWTVLRTRLGPYQFGDPPEMRWPVLDNTGTIVYTIDSLFDVSGAAFSSNSDTLFITASVYDTTESYFVGRFSLQVLDAATGRVLASRNFTTDRALQDVILDPVRPLLYVGSILWPPGASPRQYLTILDRHTLETVAEIPAVGPWWVGDATLIYQGSAGRVSVVGWCGFDCGGLWVYTYDLP